MGDWFDTHRQGVLWSPSYFAASCGGAPRNTLKSYIQQHKTPRRRFKEPALQPGALRPQR